MSTVSVPGGASAVPVITVTRGEATAGELAAVLTVLLAARSTAPAGRSAQRPRSSRWAERSRVRAAFPRPGPHAWRASALLY
jgi:acyl-CoA carboxylase epsilon subunit